VHDVTGREEIDPMQALVLGPVKVIPCEYPRVKCRSVDLQNSAWPTEELSSIADNLLLEPGMPAGPQIVAYRDGHRWQQTYVEAPLPVAADTRAIRRHGAYLVVGGTGGIGLTLAEELAGKFQARLALTCRTTLPPREQWLEWVAKHGASDRVSQILQSVQRIERHGNEVLVLSADVSDAHSMRYAVQETRERFGKIHGVVHAAGIALGGLIQLKTRESAEAVLSAKVDGALTLASLFQDDSLDFFILCSSVNAITGTAGAVDYCAANIFLDAFAASHQRKPHRIVSSLNWDAWQEVGLAANTLVPADMAESWQKHLAQGIKPAEGVEAFLRVLDAGLPQIAIITHDLQGILTQKETERAQHGEATARLELTNGHAANSGWESAAVIGDPVSDTQERIAALWRELLGVDQLKVDDNFFELGGHSLLATRVLSRVRNIFGLSVPLQVVFEAPTIRLLSEYIDTLLWATTAPAPDPSELREELEF
jgi:NAD(P)-dependent dehydrogenase (short-subunit alcohol dehydrogenase family)/acyl carrier protein